MSVVYGAGFDAAAAAAAEARGEILGVSSTLAFLAMGGWTLFEAAAAEVVESGRFGRAFLSI
jgi:hypothetical protein